MRATRPLFLLALASLLSMPLSAYTVYLKDGSRLMADGPYEVRGDTAYITLQNGTRTSIAASEIDEQRTREVNESAYGATLVLEEGGFTEILPEEPEAKDSLGDMIRRRSSSAATRPPARRPVNTPDAPKTLPSGGVDFLGLPRTPYSDLELAGEVQRVFRDQGIAQLAISQGTAPGRMLIELGTNSEGAVFRALEVAARSLLHVVDQSPSRSPVFELLLVTSDRERAGQFVLTRDDAQALADGTVEPSTFFIENVRF